jgi:hypothetical protein
MNADTDVIEEIEESVRLGVKRGVLCFIKTEQDYRIHFFSNDRYQDDVPEDFMPLRFPNWTREEAIEKFLNDSIEILNPNPDCRA